MIARVIDSTSVLRPKTDLYLEHHGILGQHWGKKNGPPYPLGVSDHSSSEKKAGWKKSLDKNSNVAHTEKKSFLINKKKALKIGAAATITALAAIGGYELYKHGKLDSLIEKVKNGKDSVESVMQKKSGESKIENSTVESIKNQVKQKGIEQLKKLTSPEDVKNIIRNANPNRGNPQYKNNCTYCCVASFLRSIGFDVTAKSTDGKQQLLGGIIESCFKNVRIIDGSAVKFGKSPSDASEMLIKKFGQNAAGVCSVQLKGGGGHAFNWSIKDGIVTFFDGQDESSLINDPKYIEQFWKRINQNDSLTLARLDNAEIIENAVKRIVE